MIAAYAQAGDSTAAVFQETASEQAGNNAASGVQDGTLVSEEDDTAAAMPLVQPTLSDTPQIRVVIVRKQAKKPGMDCRGCRSRADAEKELRKRKGYRSPKRAFFYSFLLPGAGQVYNKDYIRAGIYAAVDVAGIISSAAFYAQGKRITDDAYAYADEHFDAAKFWNYYYGLNEVIAAELPYDIDPAERDSIIQNVKLSILWDTTEFKNAAAAKDNYYYNFLESDPLVQGWNDCEPVLDPAEPGRFILDSQNYQYRYISHQSFGYYYSDTNWLFYQISKTDGDTLSNLAIWGYSASQNHYRSMIHEANNKYRIGYSILPFIALNHFVSGVDALISAVAHNRRLEGKESFLHRIRLDNRLAVSAYGVNAWVWIRVGI